MPDLWETPMTDIKLLKELAMKATPYKWFTQPSSVPGYDEILCSEKEGTIANYARSQDAAYIAAANPQAILALIARIEKMDSALKFYADMDNQVPGTSEWPKEVAEAFTGITGTEITAYDQPSAYKLDMGQRAREALGD